MTTQSFNPPRIAARPAALERHRSYEPNAWTHPTRLSAEARTAPHVPPASRSQQPSDAERHSLPGRPRTGHQRLQDGLHLPGAVAPPPAQLWHAGLRQLPAPASHALTEEPEKPLQRGRFFLAEGMHPPGTWPGDTRNDAGRPQVSASHGADASPRGLPPRRRGVKRYSAPRDAPAAPRLLSAERPGDPPVSVT